MPDNNGGGGTLADFQAWLTAQAIALAPQGLPELTLRPSRLGAFCLMVISVACAAASVAMIKNGVSGPGWVGAVVSGFFILFLFPRVFLRVVYLHLTPEGLVVSNLGSKFSAPWSAVDKFRVVKTSFGRGGTRVQRWVGFDHALSLEEVKHTPKYLSRIAGFESLPANFGLRPDILAELMTRYRVQALRRA
jgi:hypothetical protein